MGSQAQSLGPSQVMARPASWPHFGNFPITEWHHFPPAASPQCWVYLTLNAEIALSLRDNPVLQQLVRSQRVRISVDGQWLWWALRRKYPDERISKLSGSDLLDRIAAHCAGHGQRLLLLGSTARANAGAVGRLRRRWPGLQVAGWAPPVYQPADLGEQQVLDGTLEVVHDWQPHYVVLGLGASREQRVAQQLAPRLDGIVTGLFCFGGAIDLASGTVRRAPPAWQRLGLEGLWRVVEQPSRLGRFLRVLRILPVLLLRRY